MNDLKKAFDALNMILSIEFDLLGFQISFLNIILFIIFGSLLFWLLGGLLK